MPHPGAHLVHGPVEIQEKYISAAQRQKLGFVFCGIETGRRNVHPICAVVDGAVDESGRRFVGEPGEQLAVRGRLTAVYEGQLDTLARRLDDFWEQKQAALTEANRRSETAAETFAELVRSDVAWGEGPDLGTGSIVKQELVAVPVRYDQPSCRR